MERQREYEVNQFKELRYRREQKEEDGKRRRGQYLLIHLFPSFLSFSFLPLSPPPSLFLQVLGTVAVFSLVTIFIPSMVFGPTAPNTVSVF